MDSILNSVKKILGITDSYEHFDADIIMHINSVFLILNQMGVGPDTPFTISDSSETWSDFTPDIDLIPMVKTYVALKVRMIFDPPTQGSVSEAMKNQIAECEWRLNVACDPKREEIQNERV